MIIINPLIYDKYLYEQIETASLAEKSKTRIREGGNNILNETIQSYLSVNKKNTKS